MDNSPSPYYLQLNDTSIRAYTVYTIHGIDKSHYDPESVACSLRQNRGMPYPFTWHVVGNLEFVVNMIDLVNYVIQQPTKTRQRTRQQERKTHEYTRFKVIRYGNRDHVETENEQVVVLREIRTEKNLRLMSYCREGDEDGEVCVVCQVEFGGEDVVGVLRCKHRCHPKCLTQWLLRKNVCPVCKARALK